MVATLGIENIGAKVKTTQVPELLEHAANAGGAWRRCAENLQSEAARAEADAVVTRFRASACDV